MNFHSRRSFFKYISKIAFSFSFFGLLNESYAGLKVKSPIPEGQTPVSETDTTASALGFHHDVSKTDFSLYPDRKKASSKNQLCKTCAQYTMLNDGWGKCTILTNGVVNSGGWCSAWSPKQ